MNLPPDKNTVAASSDDNPYRGPTTLEQEPLDAKRMRHSLVGILSFVTSLVGVVVAAIMFVIIASFVLTLVPGQQSSTPNSLALRIGALALVTCVITSIGLGIACLCQNGRKKLFGIFGLAISTILVLGVASLMFAG